MCGRGLRSPRARGVRRKRVGERHWVQFHCAEDPQSRGDGRIRNFDAKLSCLLRLPDNSCCLACFGSRRSQVQILSPRLNYKSPRHETRRRGLSVIRRLRRACGASAVRGVPDLPGTSHRVLRQLRDELVEAHPRPKVRRRSSSDPLTMAGEHPYAPVSAARGDLELRRVAVDERKPDAGKPRDIEQASRSGEPPRAPRSGPRCGAATLWHAPSRRPSVVSAPRRRGAPLPLAAIPGGARAAAPASPGPAPAVAARQWSGAASEWPRNRRRCGEAALRARPTPTRPPRGEWFPVRASRTAAPEHATAAASRAHSPTRHRRGA